jgi:hypothetical protein
MTSNLYKVLFTYHPEEPYRAWRIGRDITKRILRLGFQPLPEKDTRYHRALWYSDLFHAHVRRRTLRSGDGAQWHQDGDYGHVPMGHGIVLWSDTHPTQIKYLGSRWDPNVIVQPQPLEVIYFNNQEVYHRRPPDAPKDRWMYRMRVVLK